MTTPSETWNCPECGGAWLESFRFDHAVTGCSIRDQEDANHWADGNERQPINGVIVRKATDAELTLAETIAGYSLTPPAQFHAPGTPAPISRPVMTKVTLNGALHHRIIGGIDPDQLKKQEDSNE